MTAPTSLISPGVAHRWPDVAMVPTGLRAAVGARVARHLFRRAAGRLPLQVVTQDAAAPREAVSADPMLLIRDENRMMRRIGTSGLIGFGESYLAGEWDAPDLAAVVEVFASGIDTLVPRLLQSARQLAVVAQPPTDRPTAQHSRRNVARHYDLSNEMFATFLDATMTYSSALFVEPDRATWPDLQGAQVSKIERILDRAQVGPGTRLLEIGTGWGELAVRAARRGAMVDSVTLSQQQLEHARDRVAEAGCADRVRLSLTDYRDVRGRYDAIVSVEMVEAVGLEFLATYFTTLADCLAPGGRVVLQAITMPHQRALATQHTYTWVHKYIFPGGAIPSLRMLREHGARAGLVSQDELPMGDSYAATLRLWAERFTEHDDELDGLGFDEIFRRMWTFYLRYSEGGFRSGYLDAHQVTYRREGAS